MQHHLPSACIQTLDERAASPTDRSLDIGLWHIRQDLGDAFRGIIQEHRIGDREGDGDACDLACGYEADDERDPLRVDFRLGDGEGSLHEGAAADADEDAEAVDGGGGGVLGDGVHEGGADDVEDAGDDVPGEVVARHAHDDAIGDAGDDQENDVGEEADAGFEGGVRVHELEEEWDEIDRDESGGARGSGFGEEDEHDLSFQELDREDASLGGGQEGQRLLEAEEDEENSRTDEEADNAAAVPRVDGAAKVDSHYAGNEGAGDEDCADVVDFSYAVFQWHTRAGIVARDEEEKDGGKERSDAKIDI